VARLDGKSAVVIGGASGIDAAAACLFVAEGARVVITDVQSDRGNELAAGLGEHANFIPQDVTHATEWDEVIGGTEARFGTINVLINNVGMARTLKSD
jgi:3alpha(or 20beta)-hydroxysteroid dehydrogenase